MEDFKNLFWSSIVPWACERFSSKFMDNLGMCRQTGLPALTQARVVVLKFFLKK
jgi:hypothetical protein